MRPLPPARGFSAFLQELRFQRVFDPGLLNQSHPSSVTFPAALLGTPSLLRSSQQVVVCFDFCFLQVNPLWIFLRITLCWAVTLPDGLVYIPIELSASFP